MQVKILDKSYKEKLNTFVPWIEQSWDFGEVQCTIQGRSDFYVFGVFDDAELMASMLVIRQEMARGKTWLWCPAGPVLSIGAWPLLKKAVTDLAKKHGDVYLRIEPYGEFEEGRESKDSYLPRDTLLIDLEKPEEEILAQMAQKGRYNVKVAQKSGVEIRELKKVDEFYEILKDTAARDGFHVHAKSFYEHFMRLATLYGAFVNGELIAGIFVTFFSDHATYYFGASSNEKRELMAPYLLQWYAILEAKKRGLKTYDFLGIAPEGDFKHSLSGVTQFKTRFGGKRVKYPPARVFVYRWGWYLLSRLAKILK